MAVTYKAADKLTVLHTQGYATSLVADSLDWHDLYTQYAANTVEVEHRYFGKSLPDKITDLDFTHLNAEQAAEDLHAVVKMLKDNKIFTGKWVATGRSKSGINTALYAYYSSKKGYDDIDVYVPFGAPFIDGLTNKSVGTYMATKCGIGSGTRELVDNLANAILREPLRQKMLSLLRQRKEYAPDVEKRKVAGVSDEEIDKSLMAYYIQTFYSNLFDKFAYVQASILKPYIPTPEGNTPEEIDWFVNADNKAILKRYLDDQKKATTRNEYTDDELWHLRRTVNTFAYLIQAAKELGYFVYDYSIVDFEGSIITSDYIASQQADELMPVTLKRYADTYSNKMMRDFLDNFLPVTDKKMVFVYCSDDPWTDAAIPYQTNPNVVKIVSPGGGHSSSILNRDIFPEEYSVRIVSAINQFLGI